MATAKRKSEAKTNSRKPIEMKFWYMVAAASRRRMASIRKNIAFVSWL